MTGTDVSRITAALTADGPADLTLDAGRVTPARPGPGRTLHAAGRVVAPAFVDAHVHLDKAHLLSAADAGGPAGAGVDGAISAMQQIRRGASPGAVARGARAGVRALVSHGVVAVRAHVEIDDAQGLDLLYLHHELQSEFAGVIDLQLTAFPQHGMTPRVHALMEEAVKDGVDVVAGCPYVDADPKAHLDAVFELAARHGRPVDLHLDFDDDPTGSLIGAVAERTRALGMGGEVTIGHATKLAAMDPDTQARALDLLAAADIALVVMPATDLYLTGFGEPGTRSMAPIERAVAAGVRVAVSNNNLRNAFSPYGNGNLLQAAWTAGLVRQMGSPQDRQLLWDSITTTPAGILGREPHGTRPGERADLVVLDTGQWADLVLQVPVVSATMVGGRLVWRREPIDVVESKEHARA